MDERSWRIYPFKPVKIGDLPAPESLEVKRNKGTVIKDRIQNLLRLPEEELEGMSGEELAEFVGVDSIDYAYQLRSMARGRRLLGRGSSTRGPAIPIDIIT